MNRALPGLIGMLVAGYGVGFGPRVNPSRELKRMWHRLPARDRATALRALRRSVELRGSREQRPVGAAMVACRNALLHLAFPRRERRQVLRTGARP